MLFPETLKRKNKWKLPKSYVTTMTIVATDTINTPPSGVEYRLHNCCCFWLSPVKQCFPKAVDTSYKPPCSQGPVPVSFVFFANWVFKSDATELTPSVLQFSRFLKNEDKGQIKRIIFLVFQNPSQGIRLLMGYYCISRQGESTNWCC